MVERKNQDRTSRSKGSQPVLFEDERQDALASMVMSLLGEVMVLKDRLDANERMLEAVGMHGPDDVDRFVPDADVSQHRGAYRQAIYDRVLGSALERLLPESLTEQSAYDGVVNEVASD
ncbi:hypothetical protein [uncultured Parasphingorhabdus sp.]|uniref:hypothetical protein n=1 Tax=uncultured Parasphingorhabdus sp. TaxID=2709694 RepID=UPI0030D8D431|tara:strand:+ start:40638 stop:40994 length:357 start_codon:yes stop_codon:yes gene_type:complete